MNEKTRRHWHRKIICTRAVLALAESHPTCRHFPASAVDVELNTLCMGDFDDEGKTLLGLFLQFIEDEMATRRHFQVLQAYLNRFLKLYEQLVVANEDLLARVESLCAVQQHKWDHVQQLLHNNLCLVY
jgi:U3 small nucleolar RNA-associated protein 21